MKLESSDLANHPGDGGLFVIGVTLTLYRVNTQKRRPWLIEQDDRDWKIKANKT